MTGTSGLALDPATRRRLGRYDTPESVALPLVRWGLRGRPGKILDPSFGGCNFLRASLQALAEAGAELPGRFVYGVDVAAEARYHGLQLTESGVPGDHLIIADFFAMSRSQIPAVDVVVGNPPYIRHHWFQAERRERAVAALARQKVRLSGRANAWAYFLVHAGTFLRQGGRMVLLLPGAVCFTEYATEALEYIRRRAGRCTLARIGERLFADAREDTVVLLVDDWGAGPCDLAIDDFESIDDLESWLRDESERPARIGSTDALTLAGLDLEPAVGEIWEHALETPVVRRLGDVAKVRIGVVTGANRFFVQPTEPARRLKAAGARSAPVVTRGQQLAGLEWNRRDQRRVERNGSPSHLVLVEPDQPLEGALSEWVAAGEDENLDERLYCRRRKVWYALTDRTVSDAFLHYMGEGWPRVVLNPARALVTNAIHRVWWQDDAISAEAAAVGSCTSLFALGCEFYGRKYGGGVLKVEPGAAVRLPVPVVPEAEGRFGEVDALLRTKDVRKACELADEVVLVRGLGLPKKSVELLRDTTEKIARRRRCQERPS